MSKSQNISDHSIEELTVYIEDYLKSRNDTMGLAIALTNDREILWAQGFGYTDDTRTERVTAETLFSSQSIGKTFTTTAFLIMASKGLIGLDDPIRKHYPNFKIRTIHGNPDEEIAQITFRKMLNHRAGLTHEALIGNNYDYSPCSFEEHINSISDWWLKSPIDSEMSYSNLGYDLTAYIMGLVKNTSFNEVMKDELFQPLGMTTTTLEIEEALKKSFAKGYEGKYAYPVVQIPMLGAGGLLFNVLDVARFIGFHLRKGSISQKQIIEPDIFEEMYKTRSNEETEYGYGLGIYSAGKIANSLVYGHAGGGYGYQTNMIWILEHKIGAVVLSNNMKNSRVGGIANKALELLIKELNITENEEIAAKDSLEKPEYEEISVEKLKRLEGTYSAENNLTSQLLRFSCENNQLCVYDMSGNRSELYPISSTKFTTKNDQLYSFDLDQGEKPNKVFVDHTMFPYKYKYNDGPNDDKGPNLEEWQEFKGIYEFKDEAKPTYLNLSINNGHLYLTLSDSLRLLQYEEKLYFTADGEALLLEKGYLIYKGIKATKIDLNIAQFMQDFKQNELRTDYYSLAVSSLTTILNTLQGFEQSLDFIMNIISMDDSFTSNLTNFGKRLFAVGRKQEAKICFLKLLDIEPENSEAKSMIELVEKIQ